MKFKIGDKVQSINGAKRGMVGIVEVLLPSDRSYRVKFHGMTRNVYKFEPNLKAFTEPVKATKTVAKKKKRPVYLFNVGDRILANPNSDYAGLKGTVIAQPTRKGEVYRVRFDAGFTGHKLEHYMTKIAKPKRRVGIFYHSHKPGLGRIPVYMADGSQVPVAYVRVELVPKGTTLSNALAKAKPQKGENLMNTHVVVVP